MRVALTGVSGFIGSVLARHLKEAGHSVTGLVRSSSRRDHVEPFVDRFVVGDHGEESCWPQLLDGADCLIHNSVDWASLKAGDIALHYATNLMASLKLLEASAPRQFVFMSTIAVHHDMCGRWKGRIDEDHPTRPGSAYGAYKASIEAHLWSAHSQSGRHVCALRPCAVYGLDPRLVRSIGYPIVKSIRAGEPFTRAGGGKFVYVEDVAAATVATVGNPAANAQVYNLVDCYARWADWAQMTAELLGVEADIDMSSPTASANNFTKDAAATLGVTLDRGHDGIRAAIQELIEATG